MASYVSRLAVNKTVKTHNVLRTAKALYSGFHFPADDRSYILKEIEPKEKKTHTGQEWDESDYRLARFIDNPKQINERFAIDLINEVPSKGVKDRVTWCNGGGGALGHPKVYINLDKDGDHSCGYCGLRFHHVPENGH